MRQTQTRIETEVEEGVAMLRLCALPGNTLERELRESLIASIQTAQADPTILAIVVIGDGSDFSVGSDLRHDDRAENPSVATLCAIIEASSKPVVAALDGMALAGGAELALACHYRIASRHCRLGFPEIQIGLPPSTGASQRLSRLIGAEATLGLLLKGRILTADQASDLGLIDLVTEKDLGRQSFRFVQALIAQKRGPRRMSATRVGFEDMARYMQEVAKVRMTQQSKNLFARSGAGEQILNLVEAAPLLPFQSGCEMEGDAYETAVSSSEARALRHLFLAERRASRGWAVSLGSTPALTEITVLGSGPLGLQITVSALEAGLAVAWDVGDRRQQSQAQAELDAVLDRAAHTRRLTASDIDSRKARLTLGEYHASAIRTGIVVDASRTDPVGLTARSVDDGTGPIWLLATPGPVHGVGLRFVPPVFANRLVEIVLGPNATDAHRAAASALARKLGKVAVTVRPTEFMGDPTGELSAGHLRVKNVGRSAMTRLSDALYRAADGLIDLGAEPYAIDAAMTEWGWSPPPFRARDLAGLRECLDAVRGPGAQNWAARLVDIGRDGWVAGQGFYDWLDNGPVPAAVVRDLLNDVRPSAIMSPLRIRQALIGALANEGLRLLDEKVVQRGSDIDVVAVLGLGMPRRRGGPMWAASEMGLLQVSNTMRSLDHPDKAFWDPDPRWASLIRDGERLDMLNG